MSASTNSPLPETPLQEDSPISPVRLSLPKPPSFSAHRRHSIKTLLSSSDSETDSALDGAGEVATDSDRDAELLLRRAAHGRSVSFDVSAKRPSLDTSKMTEVTDLASPRLYRIPQRSPGFRAAFDTPKDESSDHAAEAEADKTRPAATMPGLGGITKTARRAPPPRALNLAKSAKSINVAPAPSTAPSSRLASTAAARGLSISPALAKSGRASIGLGVDGAGSIWSASLKPSAGWASPALPSGRSVMSSARQRGLTVAVIKQDDGDMVVESGPVTPGLGSAALGTAALNSAPLRSAVLKSAALSTGKLDTASSDMKRKEIILCRYYHTPGLTCTSRPCRFVHSLDSLGSAVAGKSLSAFPMLSPRPDAQHTPDPTSGTFALAQAAPTAGGRRLSVKDTTDISQVAIGETVTVVDDETGAEVVGHVFMMSGGGKGPAGKSKAKFKTVPCKDFADGHCPYGEYCSFIHDWSNLYDPALHSEEALKSPNSPSVMEAAQHRRTSSLTAWKETIAKELRVANVAINPEALEKHTRKMSAFAAPFGDKPSYAQATSEEAVASVPPSPRVAISPRTGKFSPSILSPRSLNVTDRVSSPLAVISETVPSPPEVPQIAEPPKVSAWSKGPPVSLKKVTIAEPISPQTPSTGHLVPPSATFSLFGTGSDPATPWDPAIHAEKLREAEEAALAAQALAAQEQQTLSANAANTRPAAPMMLRAQSEPVYQYAGYQPYGPYPPPQNAHANRPQADLPPWTTATYPWGMPMSPIAPPGQGQEAFAGMPNGPGVIWTPAGWAVQDAAMKQAMRKTELGNSGTDLNHRDMEPKTYYRTRPCKFFAEGSCPYGEHCAYKHELGSDSANGQSRSPSKHSASKTAAVRHTIPCKFFNSALGCTNGDSCSFLHVLVIPDAGSAVARPRPWRTRPCRHYQLGRCVLGDACHFAHVVDPSYSDVAPCLTWTKTGRCENGSSCKYAHLGEGGEGNAEGLTEKRLAQALEELKRSQGGEGAAKPSGAGDEEDEEDDDDDLEIVTVESRAESRVMSPTTSGMSFGSSRSIAVA